MNKFWDLGLFVTSGIVYSVIFYIVFTVLNSISIGSLPIALALGIFGGAIYTKIKYPNDNWGGIIYGISM